jgi:hypothetical protein
MFSASGFVTADSVDCASVKCANSVLLSISTAAFTAQARPDHPGLQAHAPKMQAPLPWQLFSQINSVELQLLPIKPVSHLQRPRWQVPWPAQSPGHPTGVEHAFPANPMSQKQRPSQEGRGVKRDN